ncbi:MAG: ribose-phosphate pyrophosphokinase [Oscillospiraceae bacterium]|nr:ribose-phosphate pyrophosphokinase [Oscillospiraceae bacterium]
MEKEVSTKAVFTETQVADIGLIVVPGAEEMAELVDAHLVRMAKEAGFDKETFIIPSICPRFQSGDAKGLIKESVRGDDLFFIIDPGNFSLTYNLFGYENHMSPDDHFANLKRLIQAASGKQRRTTVIMPSLYGGRQHRRAARESLDCAYALQELASMGVDNVVTFDAHDPRVQNAVPLMSFDTAMPTYQVLKTLLEHMPDLQFDTEHFMVISPDEGAMNRNMYYSSVLGVNLGMFYKRRDYSVVVNGRNPIVAHEYLGESVEGKDVFIADDIIASGESMLDIGYELKKRGARRIFANATFPLFTSGLEKFDEAYEKGIISAVLGTNLTYRTPELREREWFYEVDMSKYITSFITAISTNMSVSRILDPIVKINALLEGRDND